MNENNKEIVVLSDVEHLRLRPTVYVGSVKPSNEKIHVIRDKRIYIEDKLISVGMYKLFDEVFSNSLDEAKRMKGKMKEIVVNVSSKNNTVLISDTGNGFFNGEKINKVSGKTNIESAVSMLRAGSNFKNDDTEESLIGTNGMGLSCVTGLSKKFKIITVNDKIRYEQTWDDFVTTGPSIKKHSGTEKKGTSIEFQPLSSIFGNHKWDKEILMTTLMFKRDIIKKDKIVSNLNVRFIWDDAECDITTGFLPIGTYEIETPIGQMYIWEKYEGSGSISFINSAMCTGIHQKIVNDVINTNLDDTLGHHFYDVYLSLNLPPKLVSFADQNKTRYITRREEVEPTINKHMLSSITKFFRSDLYKKIQRLVEERRKEGELKKIRKEKKSVNLKNNNKYFPASSPRPKNFFILEGLCIDSNEKINIWRNGEFMNVKMSDTEIGDEVITHKNRFKKIINKQKKLKECIEIFINEKESIMCTREHRLYVFNEINKEFYFKPAGDIDIDIEKLVRSNLNQFVGTLEVLDTFKNNDKDTMIRYPNCILLEDGSMQTSSDEHKYCIYDNIESCFKMESAKNIKNGDLFSLFL